MSVKVISYSASLPGNKVGGLLLCCCDLWSPPIQPALSSQALDDPQAKADLALHTASYYWMTSQGKNPKTQPPTIPSCGINFGDTVAAKNNRKNPTLTEKPWTECCERQNETLVCINKQAGFVIYWSNGENASFERAGDTRIISATHTDTTPAFSIDGSTCVACSLLLCRSSTFISRGKIPPRGRPSGEPICSRIV